MRYADVVVRVMRQYIRDEGDSDWLFSPTPFELAKKAQLRLGSAIYGMETTTGDDWDMALNEAMVHDLMDVIALCTLAIDNMPGEAVE